MKIFALIIAMSVCAAAQEHKVGVARYVPPKYPPIGVQARVQGDVVLDLKVNAAGEVASVDVVSGHPMLKDAAVRPISQWRFICLDCAWGEPFSVRFTVAFQSQKEIAPFAQRDMYLLSHIA